MKEMYTVYARWLNQNIFIYQTVFSARFDERGEEDQVLDEYEININLNGTKILTESDITNIGGRS